MLKRLMRPLRLTMSRPCPRSWWLWLSALPYEPARAELGAEPRISRVTLPGRLPGRLP
jgi:hypothetical protein